MGSLRQTTILTPPSRACDFLCGAPASAALFAALPVYCEPWQPCRPKQAVRPYTSGGLCMTVDFYTTWLGIAPGPRPPDYYTLLGVLPGCADVEQIETAAQEKLDRLDRYSLSTDPLKRDAVQRLMNEVARARMTLTAADRRAAYDAELKA